ncbi:MAG TPA: hypothetical protein PLR20_14740 [Syntrophales bacterium]|nr:hypothetical protein [Syntrophales bacterium]
MNLFEVKDPLVIEVPFGGRRLIAELFPLEVVEPGKKGLVFFDTWWRGATAHPVHIVEGEILGDGPWDIPGAEAEVELLDMTNEDDPLVGEWKDWQRYLKEDPDGRLATRELAEEIVKSGNF